MSCYSPIQAYKADKVNPTGKRSLVWKPQGSWSGVRLKVPCGNCPGCRLERSRTWGIRCMHEKRMHRDSCFLTLTYRKECLPEFGTLVKRDLVLFHKRLHMKLTRERGFGIRYFGCGEYGTVNQRPHYHSLIFGFDPSDKLVYRPNGRGDMVYTSKLLEDIWTFGSVFVGEVSFDSACYVARYSLKKAPKLARDDGHYLVYDGNGQVFERVPEFPVMSRRPGIGSTYFDKFGSEIMAHDTIIMGNREVPSIRYYDLKIEKIAPERMRVIRRNRMRKSVWSERQTDRMRVKEVLLLTMQKRKVRDL